MNVSSVNCNSTAFDPDVKLQGLTPEQEQVARQKLREECESFSRDDYDYGCAPDLEMDIKQHDHEPVQKT